MLPLVVLCVALDSLQQVWVEWKRAVWGQAAMAVREKVAILIGQVFSSRAS